MGTLALTLPDVLGVTLLLGDLFGNILGEWCTLFHMSSFTNLKWKENFLKIPQLISAHLL